MLTVLIVANVVVTTLLYLSIRKMDGTAKTSSDDYSFMSSEIEGLRQQCQCLSKRVTELEEHFQIKNRLFPHKTNTDTLVDDFKVSTRDTRPTTKYSRDSSLDGERHTGWRYPDEDESQT